MKLHGRDVSRLGAAARASRSRTHVPTAGPLRLAHGSRMCGARAGSVAGRRRAALAARRTTRRSCTRRRRRTTRSSSRESDPCSTCDWARSGSAQQRMVELARCLAGPFDVLLLDEPSAGLDRSETDRFADVLREIVSVRDVAVLLVEHDMSVVMGVCQYIYVLDFGRLVFEGDPETVRASPIVPPRTSVTPNRRQQTAYEPPQLTQVGVGGSERGDEEVFEVVAHDALDVARRRSCRAARRRTRPGGRGLRRGGSRSRTRWARCRPRTRRAARSPPGTARR